MFFLILDFKMHNKTAANATVESARHYFNLAQQANEDVQNAIANLPSKEASVFRLNLLLHGVVL